MSDCNNDTAKGIFDVVTKTTVRGFADQDRYNEFRIHYVNVSVLINFSQKDTIIEVFLP